MLAMTQEAAAAVDQIVSQPEVPPTAVLRIAAQESRGNGNGPEQEVQLELVEEPPARDLVVQEMRISVEQRSLAFLDDKVLDVEVGDAGIEFTLRSQSSFDG